MQQCELNYFLFLTLVIVKTVIHQLKSSSQKILIHLGEGEEAEAVDDF